MALEAYQRAREPKKLLLPGGHFDAYVKDFETVSVARDWFLEHLGSSG